MPHKCMRPAPLATGQASKILSSGKHDSLSVRPRWPKNAGPCGTAEVSAAPERAPPFRHSEGVIMAALATFPDISKLVPLLGSDKDGEILAAAAAIGRALKGAGLHWHNLTG